jgi:SpoVK/Ycf46/Vps4 family AAA+-type ATPase
VALELLRKGEAGEAAAMMAELFYDAVDSTTIASEIPSRFDPSEIKREVRNALDEAKTATSFNPNHSQENAIMWALNRRISLIRGPPGTGKTRVAALLISTALRLHTNSAKEEPKPTSSRVLAVTHSNGAADVLMEALLQMGVPVVRVGRPASVSPRIVHRTVIAKEVKSHSFLLLHS